MIGDILSDRLRDYAPANAIEQENVLSELMQHYVLSSLSRARFFSQAVFHGGTCLRILYGMNRFSEDLDFLLRKPDPGFQWKSYVDRILSDCEAEGIRVDVQDKSSADTTVKKLFFETDFLGERLAFPYPRHSNRKVKIKLEIDSNPPEGSRVETRYITFPLTSAITTQTLTSSFGLKSHALLCREYTKGRDWYDFLWYTGKKTIPDLKLLANALEQQGAWSGKDVCVTPEWYLEAMRDRIKEIDWGEASDDAKRFIMARELDSLSAWDYDLFLQQLDHLGSLFA